MEMGMGIGMEFGIGTGLEQRLQLPSYLTTYLPRNCRGYGTGNTYVWLTIQGEGLKVNNDLGRPGNATNKGLGNHAHQQHIDICNEVAYYATNVLKLSIEESLNLKSPKSKSHVLSRVDTRFVFSAVVTCITGCSRYYVVGRAK